MKVFIIRHGQTDWNLERRAQGHSDVPLNATGEMQANALAQSFHDRGLSKVFTSDLQRSVRTAAPLAEVTGAELISTACLRERSFGKWEGKPYEAIRAGVLASALPSQEFVPPGGESMASVRERLKQWLSLTPLETDLAIVSHGGACSVLLALLLECGAEASHSFSFSNAGVTSLRRRDDGGFTLVDYNSTTHLEGVANEAFGVIG